MSDLIDRIAAEAEREPDRVLPGLHALPGEPVEVTDLLRPVAALTRAEQRRGAVTAC